MSSSEEGGDGRNRRATAAAAAAVLVDAVGAAAQFRAENYYRGGSRDAVQSEQQLFSGKVLPLVLRQKLEKLLPAKEDDEGEGDGEKDEDDAKNVVVSGEDEGDDEEKSATEQQQLRSILDSDSNEKQAGDIGDGEHSASFQGSEHCYTADELEECLLRTSNAIVSVQEQIQKGEDAYYDGTCSHGNLMQGWDGFIDARAEIQQNGDDSNGNNNSNNNNNNGGSNFDDEDAALLANVSFVSAAASANPPRRIPADYRWFSTGSTTISLVESAAGAAAASSTTMNAKANSVANTTHLRPAKIMPPRLCTDDTPIVVEGGDGDRETQGTARAVSRKRKLAARTDEDGGEYDDEYDDEDNDNDDGTDDDEDESVVEPPTKKKKKGGGGASGTKASTTDTKAAAVGRRPKRKRSARG